MKTPGQKRGIILPVVWFNMIVIAVAWCVILLARRDIAATEERLNGDYKRMVSLLQNSPYDVGRATFAGDLIPLVSNGHDCRGAVPLLLPMLHDLTPLGANFSIGAGMIHTATDVTSPAEEAARVLGEMGDLRAVMPLIQALSNPDPGDRADDLRAEAAKALGNIADPRAVLPLETARDDGNPDVAAAAAEALERIAQKGISLCQEREIRRAFERRLVIGVGYGIVGLLLGISWIVLRRNIVRLAR